jgi:hypothetical protein
MLRVFASLLSLVALGLAGCDVSPVDAAGTYSISLTSKENGCAFENWMEGNTSTGIPIAITQEDDLADATVGGVAATYLDIVLGSHVYSGDVSGHHLELVLNGTRETQSLGCAYFVTSVMDARLDGDLLEGQLIYTVNDNGSPDCQSLENCESVQDFNGTRPPQ